MSEIQTATDRFPNSPLLPSRLVHAAEDAFGAAVAGSFGAADSFALWVAVADGWILFFLWSMPLWDLTWRWNFFHVFHQRVNPQAIVGVVILFLNAIAIAYRSAWRRLPKRVLIFLGLATFSALVSFSSQALNELLRGLAGLTFFYTAGPLLARRSRFDRFAKLFLGATAVPVMLCFFQVAGIIPYDYWDWAQSGRIGRASGTYPTPLSLAYFLDIAFPLGLYIAYGRKQSPVARRWARIFLILASVALYFTYHRTSYFIVALQFCMFFVMTRKWKALRRTAVFLAIIALFSLGRLDSLYTPLWHSFSGNTSWESSHFMRGRGIEWYIYLSSYASSGPFHWVFGLGSSKIPEKFLGPLNAIGFKPEPHNDYIRILHSYGAVGLLLYLFILALLITRAFHLLRSQDEFARSLGVTAILILFAVMVQSMMIEMLYYPAGAWYLFAVGSAMFCVRPRPDTAPGRAAA